MKNNSQKIIEIKDDSGMKVATVTIETPDGYGVKEFAKFHHTIIKKVRRRLLEIAIDNELDKLGEGGKGDGK
ncbi:hypothetical protein E0765_07055 [Sulfuricurvum sp. IAE1]|uniref:hypothetical protein n=1 Tax=Sulfuricurvum sp. IAE1 TaxID=2546102 RepID=UPI00104B7709|nr:hypothetical protein [Sulfuricurvum sp. IAE1]TDA63586.1 hypothetical protein E0765_07055 [Sulfuricurvum sp. IAE1]